MKLTRRDFLKLGGAATAGVLVLDPLRTRKASAALKHFPLRKRIGETVTICPFDASGCGFIVAADGGNVINIEGDPDHPINRGAACAKGASLSQLRTVDGKLNPRRLTHVQYRAAGATEWQPMSWGEAIERIARKIKDTREAHWIGEEGGITVNRTEGIASVGGAALDNEECYLLVKMLRSLGLVYVEHQARI